MKYHLPFNSKLTDTYPLTILSPGQAVDWASKQADPFKKWLKSRQFGKKRSAALSYPTDRGLAAVGVVENPANPESFAELVKALPEAAFHLENNLDSEAYDNLCLGWAMQTYEFTRYKKTAKKQRILAVEPSPRIRQMIEAIYWVRDLVNTPANELGPQEIEDESRKLVDIYKATHRVIAGEELLKENYPSLYLVGKGARTAGREPRFIDLTWGNEKHPRVTLVGKGITFDTGGLDLKPSDMMLTMKKDMAGAAHALALAHLIMAAKLPVRLRVMIAVAENSVDADSMRPMDIVKTRKGITVEIGNTDAEGRVAMCDLIHEACTEKPEILIDFATLTGAARAALGAEIGAFFTNHEAYIPRMMELSAKLYDPVWPLPLHAPYARFNEARIADISNNPGSKYGGAIMAALFLKEFVAPKIKWMHFDIMAYNLANRPGHPAGGEAQSLRTVFHFLEEEFGE